MVIGLIWASASLAFTPEIAGPTEVCQVHALTDAQQTACRSIVDADATSAQRIEALIDRKMTDVLPGLERIAVERLNEGLGWGDRQALLREAADSVLQPDQPANQMTGSTCVSPVEQSLWKRDRVGFIDGVADLVSEEGEHEVGRGLPPIIFPRDFDKPLFASTLDSVVQGALDQYKVTVGGDSPASTVALFGKPFEPDLVGPLFAPRAPDQESDAEPPTTRRFTLSEAESSWTGRWWHQTLTVDDLKLRISTRAIALEEGNFQNSSLEVAQAIAKLPEPLFRQLRDVKEIKLEGRGRLGDAWRARAIGLPGYSSYMTVNTGIGEINIYPWSPKQSVDAVLEGFRHELTHVWAAHCLGKEGSARWNQYRQVIRADGNFPSEYAKTDIAEDLPEFAKQYFGAVTDQQKADLQKKFPNRFAFVTRYLEITNGLL